MAYEGNKPIEVLLPEDLKSYSLTGNGDFPRISKMEIEDKSKGDFISKAVVILQTNWFVMQCIARGVQGLPITELELATVAFAGLNIVIYVLWWDKPLNVQCGVRVYEKRITDSPVDDGHVEARPGFWAAFGNAISKLPAVIVRGPLQDQKQLQYFSWLSRVLMWTVVKPLFIIVGDGDDTVGKRVDTFSPTNLKRYRIGQWLVMIVTAGIASAFGGIHYIGSTFTFPSNTEKTLWHLTSISITCIPIALFLTAGLADGGLINEGDAMILVPASILQLSLYIPCRLALLILPFLCLRSLPLATYHTVHWMSFIPHI